MYVMQQMLPAAIRFSAVPRQATVTVITQVIVQIVRLTMLR